MPDILTHILFAEGVKDLIDDSNVRQFIEDNEKLYNLGAQGPDILFYYKPWNPMGSGIRETGQKMHHVQTGKFFKDAVNQLNKMTGTDYENFLVYILGFLCHYYCDKSAHPYVNSMVKDGCYTNEGKRKKLTHYQIEATIDTRLWNEEKRLTAARTNVAELIRTEKIPESVPDYLSRYIYETQTFIISHAEIRKAVSNMHKVLDILFDPEDRKKKIINRLPLPRKCYVDNEFEDVDVLNLAGRPWEKPGHEGKTYDSSVGELLAGAIRDCAKTVNAIAGMLENGDELDLDKTIPNEDYGTGDAI